MGNNMDDYKEIFKLWDENYNPELEEQYRAEEDKADAYIDDVR